MFLSLNQSNNICLTPEMQHGIKILSMSSSELNEEIDKCLDNNYLVREIDSNKTFKNSSLENFEDSDFFDKIAYKKNIREHLREQIILSVDKSEVREFAIELVEYINDDGLLSDFNSVNNNKLFDSSLKVLQAMEPSGVGGRNFVESIALQASNNGWKTETEMILNHIDLIASMNIDSISKKVGVSRADAEKALKNIKSLNPKPGSAYPSFEQIIAPDGYIHFDGNEIEIGTFENVKKIDFISGIKNIVKDDPKLKIKQLEARSLINGISHRNKTLILILNALTKLQSEFFINDEVCLKPLTMSEIADYCNIHESTVSRVSNSKYVETKYGVLKIKDFFCSGVKVGDGEIASRSVKKMIKSLISEELAVKPISDMKITNTLNGSGIQISRRTVAKYRTSMDIPNSSERIINFSDFKIGNLV